MQQTPLSDTFNTDLLELMAPNYRHVVEVGSALGLLAQAYLAVNPSCRYTGIEIHAEYATASQQHCTDTRVADIEAADDAFFAEFAAVDCWIFGDVLEHLHDPWRVLQRIRQHGRKGVAVIVSVPNLQNWVLQSRINAGQFFYMDSGLLDRTHIRWFTRITLLRMFIDAGYTVETMAPRILHQPDPAIMQAIRHLASVCGNDPDSAERDALPFQYVLRAIAN